ncbi:MAG: zf-HC2 domain-containing protein [Chloroflexi bacterium]|nr:MAG: zf-HC2 domain-containing protein [Chloroflexota bacterium]
MSTHGMALDRLAPYADDALSLEERAAVQRHVQGCARCMLELKRLLELNAVLQALAPAPPASSAAFWLRLRARLPRPASFLRVGGFRPGRRPALAFALACVLALTLGTGAFAAGTSLPDSPLYPLKRMEERLQLDLAFAPQARFQIEVQLANERLREARAMSGLGKTMLAAASLRDFNQLLSRIAPRLSNDDLAAFQLQLTALQQVSNVHRDDASGLIASQLGLSGEPTPSTAQAGDSQGLGNGGTDDGQGNGGVPGDGHAYGKGHGKGPVQKPN